MEARAEVKYVRLSAPKVRRVVSLIRGRPVAEAQALLQFTPSPAARVVAGVLKSAVANAENNLELAKDTLVVARAYVDEGPVTKRVHPRARGRADVLAKKSSHITVIVADSGR
jgi:large subunit ribosomal protein L22